jgi:hypothetical protein
MLRKVSPHTATIQSHGYADPHSEEHRQLKDVSGKKRLPKEERELELKDSWA